MISLARAILRNLTVTHGDVRDALRLDPVLLRSAEIRPFEEVEIVNLATGTRLRTWVEEAAETSGEVHAPGARIGDRVTVVAYTMLHEGQTLAHKVKLVSVDAANRVVAITE
ncbi:MAG TPA: aspartate 1-decarboxylase [Thermoanaerobaculia bacterium]|jgi:aspartate 1-decarboxylase|nr:aspartate 1-decarboxylase [Thermoanaerobaculia bacterium]